MVMQKARGLTLIELMIVIAIVSILAAIGYPAMTKYVQKSRRAEAKSALQDLALRQTRWRANHTSYTSTLTDLTGLSPSVTGNLPDDYYAYSVVSASTGASTFKIQADGSGTSQATDEQKGTSCATLTLNASDGHGTNDICW